jgi:hypothetical protein
MRLTDMRATGIGSCSAGQIQSPSRQLARFQARADQEPFRIFTGLEHNMNQIIAETNVIETEEPQAPTGKQVAEAVTELNAAQLALVGGGTGTTIFD